MRTRVYIAGPISKGDLQRNIDQARDAARKLIQAGFAPLCPQLTCFMASNEPSSEAGFAHQVWMEVDLPWVQVADAVLRLPGESTGADREVEHAKALGIPVVDRVDDLAGLKPRRHLLAERLDAILAERPHAKSAEFYTLLVECAELHARKAKDYGTDSDPLANVRASEVIGIPAWKGAWLRARDKVKRLDTYCVKGSLANEGVEDSWQDLAVYSLICLILHRESRKP